MGFDHVATPPLFVPGSAGDLLLAGDLRFAHLDARSGAGHGAPVKIDIAIGDLVEACRRRGLSLITDVVLDRVDASGVLATANPDLFRVGGSGALPDPRASRAPRHVAFAQFDRPDAAKRLLELWAGCLSDLLKAGVSGFRFHNPNCLSAGQWRSLSEALRRAAPEVALLAWTPGLAWPKIEALAGAGFDVVFSSLPWWDRRATWFIEELDLLRRVASVIACPEAPFGPRLASRLGPADDVAAAYRQALRVAAATGDGLMVPMGFEFALPVTMDARRSTPKDFDSAHGLPLELSADIRAANELVGNVSRFGAHGEVRALTGPGNPVTAFIRFDAPDARAADRGIVVLINPDLSRPNAADIAIDPLAAAAGGFGKARDIEDSRDPLAPLQTAEVRILEVERLKPVAPRLRPARERSELAAVMAAPRVVIDAVAPRVDGGRFPTKFVAGDRIAVEAGIYADGHGAIGADLMWRAADEKEWRREPMQLRDNDRWQSGFASGRIGRHEFTIEAWADDFATICRDIGIKRRAGLNITLEIEEARRLIDEAAGGELPAAATLSEIAGRLAAAQEREAADLLLDPRTAEAMRQAAPRRFCVRRDPVVPVEIDRPQAAFGAWYELFPRSAAPEPGCHGTFADVVALLPEIRAMGFDVLYLPPIHPIGRTNRKGRNNGLIATPSDPGSPYAIGAAEGGHDAIHPQLGTFEDFRHLVAAAAECGIEVAIDFAIQCSPDHPWLKEHPEWFRWRADGSLRYAENPPKKYEDIVNVEFYPDRGGAELWLALRDVVLFWIGHGVRIFRVDNPHTKPLPFWEWLIADIRARHPATLFLSEAFTRPKMMYRLAKIGFSQSYTYFTWRNTKRELTEYLTELTSAPVATFFRPHFFVNTPDINPYFLQRSGRAGFLIRAALAATLAGLWGIYSGFELCEASALPGREEYLDAEKYEIKHRDRNAPGNIKAEIARLNRIRRIEPALQSHRGLTFYNAYNDEVMVYGKALPPRRDMILVAVSLDPHRAQEATFEVPLWEWGLPDHASLVVEDLIDERRFVWTGKLQHVRLDPAQLPYAIWRIAPLAGGAR
jgi:starch synthase (maltosyl-transferring)